MANGGHAVTGMPEYSGMPVPPADAAGRTYKDLVDRRKPGVLTRAW